MDRFAASAIFAVFAFGLLIPLRPGIAQGVTLLGQESARTGTLSVGVSMRPITIGPPPVFGPQATSSSASGSGLRLDVRSRFGSSLDYFYYQAEVHANDPKVASRIRKVEYIDYRSVTALITDAPSHYRHVHHSWGIFTLKARVTLAPRVYIPRFNKQTVVELQAKVPYPGNTKPLGVDLRFVENSRYVGDGRYYVTELKLQGTPTALARVVAVEYQLHPTFSYPRRSVTDRADGFALRLKLWGMFRIGIKILHDDGTVTHTHHDLVL